MPRQIVFSVNAGKVGVDPMRDLREVWDGEGTEMGIHNAMHPTTKETCVRKPHPQGTTHHLEASTREFGL